MSASSSLTTLQLAEAIARAVLAEVDEHGVGQGSAYGVLLPHDEYFPDTRRADPDFDSLGDHLRHVVLQTLRDNGCWFCRVTEGPEPVGGIVKSEQMELTY